MRVQLASDIHLERNPHLTFKDLLSPNGDILVLAGDIGCPRHQTYQSFLKQCQSSFKHVIVVNGNHEYKTCSNMSMEEVDIEMVKLCKQIGTNVHYLCNGNNIVIDSYNFIGATLWSDISKTHFTQSDIDMLNKMWSQQRVRNQIQFTVDEHNILYQTQLRAIEKNINYGLENKLKNIIITHHAPLIDGPFKRRNLPKDYVYGSDLSSAIKSQFIKAWFFGHTHHNYISVLNGVLVASNQYGASGIDGWCNSISFTL